MLALISVGNGSSLFIPCPITVGKSLDTSKQPSYCWWNHGILSRGVRICHHISILLLSSNIVGLLRCHCHHFAEGSYFVPQTTIIVSRVLGMNIPTAAGAIHSWEPYIQIPSTYKNVTSCRLCIWYAYLTFEKSSRQRRGEYRTSIITFLPEHFSIGFDGYGCVGKVTCVPGLSSNQCSCTCRKFQVGLRCRKRPLAPRIIATISAPLVDR